MKGSNTSTFHDVERSWNGLLCMTLNKKASNIVFWNSATIQYRFLPKPRASILQDYDPKSFMVGFGFEVADNRENAFQEACSSSSVFSMRRNSWRMMNSSDLQLSPNYTSLTQVSVNGVVYWLAHKWLLYILIPQLQEEEEDQED